MRKLLCALALSSLALGAQPVTPPAVSAATPLSKPLVRIQTSYGPIVLELEPSAAPATVANFLRYVREGHYSGTIFHRVIPGFMIQGGGFSAGLMEKPTHAPIRNEAQMTFQAGLKNTRGTVAMARTEDPDSATAQFYINTADNPALDFRSATPSGVGYCVFGRVVEGMDAVDRIEKVRTVWRHGMQDVPDFAVRIKSAEELPAK
nr:peptidylprolyl isomerase [uncultured Holophaga sp.]